MADVLVVSSSMGMFYWVHGNTTNLRPAVSLNSVFVIGVACFEKGFLGSTAACNLSDHGTATTRNNFFGAGWEFNPTSAIIGVMTDDNSIVPRRPREHSTISDMVLNVAYDCALRDRAKRKNITDHEGGFAPAVHELAGVHTLSRNKELLLVLVTEGVAEGNAGEGGTTARVMYDVGDHALEISIALAEVEAAEPSWAFAMVSMGSENRSRTLSLSSDHSPHGGGDD